ncbi:hypothetical protein [Erythrobacter sp. JK5]|uniref:hypothetical protein n=1 Tax=Erythrobacter sp. JK5 TaxID=2829500 RepID=UPI001BADAF07|nr:hypothetical protein [Erythrobacter sp. JK5]QUL36896.1 hypothetical protein KDC96_10810 [Erythrobacter sp. JK5]
MDHRELSYPILVWSKEYVFLAKTTADFERTPRTMFEELRQQARDGEVKLIDSKGFLFHVVDELIISTRNPILKWLVEFKTAPVLAGGQKLSLEEFKQCIKQAIRVRQRGEYDSDFVGELNQTLTSAVSYEDALNSVPRGM